MGVMANEPSMEDILSSIKRIIADGSERGTPSRAGKRRTARAESDSAFEGYDAQDVDPEEDAAVLELTDIADENGVSEDYLPEMDTEIASVSAVEQPASAPARTRPSPKAHIAPESVAAAATPDAILSDSSAQAARQSLVQLSSLLVRPQEGESNTLEGLVREMLRPMLKEWLEAQLPELVETMVKKEIDRIVGRLG